MRTLIFWITILVLAGSCKRNFLEVEVFSVGPYNRQESILRSDLKHALNNALGQEDVEIIVEDNYLLQCRVFFRKEGDVIKSFLVRWNFTNLDNPDKNVVVEKVENLDSFLVQMKYPYDHRDYMRLMKKSFIKQLIKKKIIKAKANDARATDSSDPVAFLIDFLD